ncbi:MAG: GNAT family N-acetyltransferase [Chloroflexota bacterium]
MHIAAIEIRPFDPQTTDMAALQSLSDLENTLRREILPDDPPIPLEERIQSLRNIPSFIDVWFWSAWDTQAGKIVAQADSVVMRTDENQHLLQFSIEVLPSYRRQGLARRLLTLVVETAQRENRRLLLTNTSGRIPAGEAFMERLGAQRGLVGATNQLRVEDLDRALLQTWQAQAQQRAAGFALGLWEGAYPEEQIEAIANLWELTNQQPFEDLEVDPIHYGPEELRQMEKSMAASGTQRWTLYAYEISSGKLAGYTELMWNPNRPETVGQGMTGVFPEYRNKGLGRWLKAAMLQKLLDERPQVRFVRTQNANSNAPMLHINTALGFKPYTSNILWQVALDKVMAYLA